MELELIVDGLNGALTGWYLIFLEFNNPTNSLNSLLNFIGMGLRHQFKKDFQPLFRRE